MAYLRVEDLTGSIEVIVFPDLYQVTATLFDQDTPLLITGTLDHGDKGTKLKATRILPLTQRKQITIALSAKTNSPSDITRLHKILQRSPGQIPVVLKVTVPAGNHLLTESIIAVDDGLKVDGSQGLIDELTSTFGQGTVMPESSETTVPLQI